MKGVILRCLEKMVVGSAGNQIWRNILDESGLPRDYIFFASQDVDDGLSLKVVGAACNVLNISLQQAADAFGEYWVTQFAPAMYEPFFKGKSSAREFLLKMDKVHETVTQNVPGARPPRFDYEWDDEDTLIMTYHSHRGLIDFLVGLIKGVGKHFGEELRVTKLNDERVEVVFS